MIGYWIIERFDGVADAAGCKTQVAAANKMEMNIKAILYLPPYLRTAQSGIGVGDTVWGIIDDATGIGAALFGVGAADFGYYFDADIKIKKSLDVTGNISTAADVKATDAGGDVTLRTHWHGYIDTIEGAPTPKKTQAANTIEPV